MTELIKKYNSPLGLVSMSHVSGEFYLVRRGDLEPLMCEGWHMASAVFTSHLNRVRQKYFESIGMPDYLKTERTVVFRR